MLYNTHIILYTQTFHIDIYICMTLLTQTVKLLHILLIHDECKKNIHEINIDNKYL